MGACNVVLLFSKVPEAGLVKTRLTTLKDGMLTPEMAARLYECMLLDVVSVILRAFDHLGRVRPLDRYELVVSTTPAASVPKMRELLAANGIDDERIAIICDEGASFDEHYDDAFSQAWERGADRILSMGADMPALTCADVERGLCALAELDERGEEGIVIAPDQEMGVSIIGWGRRTCFDHQGVFYNPEGLTVLPAYVRKAKQAGLPARWLPPVPDVDTMADLFHNITLVEALAYCAPFDGGIVPSRTWGTLREWGMDELRVMPNELRDPREHIDA